MQVFRKIWVPMADGTRLATTIYLPSDEGAYPCVLVRTAYSRVAIYDLYVVEHGMVLIVQDCRGRYESEGDFYPFIHEPSDGLDTLRWLADQPWCNGKIGMFGTSYLAATQYLAVLGEGAPLLTTLNPRFMTGDCWQRAYYSDGAFSLALTWTWLCFECAGRVTEAGILPRFNVRQLVRKLPLVELDHCSGSVEVPYYRDYVINSSYNDFWRGISIRPHYAKFTMPMLFTAGWYDYYPADMIASFLAVCRHAPSEEVRQSHRLIIGPWPHGQNPRTDLGDIDFGEASLQENDSTGRWLDCLLHNRPAIDFQEAPIRIFVMGINQWRDVAEWPLPGTQWVPWYLRSDHRLTMSVPTDEAPECYTYDPDDPVPTLGGNHSLGSYNLGLYEFVKPGPFDQRPVEVRHDVLVYTSDPLSDDLEVTGPITLTLYAASTAPDTDFVGRLTDVYPDGRSINITEGIIRARYRARDWEHPELIEPGQVLEYKIDLQVTSNVFKAGHRLRLQITSSNFPLWDRNPNTGHDIGMDDCLSIAQQTIHHDRHHPSHILLPVVPKQAHQQKPSGRGK